MSKFQYFHENHDDAIVKKCCDTGCKLDLQGLDEVLVLKGEKLFPKQTICDCIIFLGENSIIAGVVELKSKTVDVSKVKDQLSCGLRFVKQALERSKTKHCLKRYFVVVLAKKWRIHERKSLIARKIPFDGKKLMIIPKNCGDKLSDILKS